MAIRRRALLRAGLAGGLGWAWMGSVERAAAALLAPRPRLAPAGGDTVLVVVDLFGGNDGLNTVVPLRQYARYSCGRPSASPASACCRSPAWSRTSPSTPA
ncbi:MAG: hypothetical protein U0802_04110 [Candidatus Binatia bacterium]